MSTASPAFKPARPAAPVPSTTAAATQSPSALAAASTAAAEPAARLQSGTACSTSWSAEEQATLDSAIFRFPADKHQPLERYVHIAATLSKKSVRDVAFRIRWLTITQAARKRQLADSESSKQRQQQQFRRERGQSIFSIQPKLPMSHMAMYAPHPGSQPNPHLDDHGSASVGAMGGPVAQLLEQNYAVLNQFKRNMAQYKVSENTDLLARFRDNLMAILHQMDTMQGVMQRMPPLPVHINSQLAQSFLPKCVGGAHAFPMGMPFMPPAMSGIMPAAGMNGFMGAVHMQPGMQPGASGAAQSGEVPAPATAHIPVQQAQQRQQQIPGPQASLQLHAQPAAAAASAPIYPPHMAGVPMPGSMAPAAGASPMANGHVGAVPPQLQYPVNSMPVGCSVLPAMAGMPPSAALPAAGPPVPGSMQGFNAALSLPPGTDFAPHGPFSLVNGSSLAPPPFDLGAGQHHQLQPHTAEHPHAPACGDTNLSQPVAIKAE